MFLISKVPSLLANGKRYTHPMICFNATGGNLGSRHQHATGLASDSTKSSKVSRLRSHKLEQPSPNPHLAVSSWTTNRGIHSTHPFSIPRSVSHFHRKLDTKDTREGYH